MSSRKGNRSFKFDKHSKLRYKRNGSSKKLKSFGYSSKKKRKIMTGCDAINEEQYLGG